MKLHDLRTIVSLSCEEASRLASESLDRELTRGERWALRFHTFVCRSCRRMMRQLKVLHAAAARMRESARRAIRAALPQLSADRKRRIKQMLADAQQADHN